MTRKHMVTPKSEKIIKVDKTLSRRFQFVVIICAGLKMLLCTLGVSFDANAMQCSQCSQISPKRHRKIDFLQLPFQKLLAFQKNNKKIRFPFSRGRLS